MHILFLDISCPHVLCCPKVVQQCPVGGFGQSYIRDDLGAHLTETVDRRGRKLDFFDSGLR